jgi:UDPglucose--hexose-1-phosphate uridylyltransferase
MPELRVDPLTGTHVILAPGRASRPNTHRDAVASDVTRSAAPNCPFGPGNEHLTPPEVFRTGDGSPDTPGWRARVVPNLYPIVGGELPGAHEVVVLSPDHDAPLGKLSDAQATEVLGVLRDRAAHHLGAGLVHAQPFVNYGRAAGASIEHPHAQLVALAAVPPAVAHALQLFATAPDDLVLAAMRDGGDNVIWPGDAVAWCAPASLSPYEVLIALASSGARFDRATDAEIAATAVAVQRVLRAVSSSLGDVPYNVVVHTAPGIVEHGFHWYVRVTPRITVTAGFEFATGILVNTVPAEQATSVLREAISAE